MEPYLVGRQVNVNHQDRSKEKAQKETALEVTESVDEASCMAWKVRNPTRSNQQHRLSTSLIRFSFSKFVFFLFLELSTNYLSQRAGRCGECKNRWTLKPQGSPFFLFPVSPSSIRTCLRPVYLTTREHLHMPRALFPLR